ncbi:MAG: IS110 family transposase [Acidimicrobiales bacterium]
MLCNAGMHCEVIAPSLIPARPGDRVKTDKRDARRLALLFRAGQLSAVRVPTVAEEAVRDLCRARADMVIDRTRARHRLGKFLLRHGRVWRGGVDWTLKHEAWIGQQRFGERALNQTLAHYQATLTPREAAVDAIDADLAQWYDRPPFADPVHRLAAHRGVTQLGGLTLASEVCDWRRIPTAGMFMAFTGLVPSEDSTGERTRRGGITHAGNGPPTGPTRRGGLGLQVPPGRRHGDQATPTRPRPRRDRPSVGRPAASVRQVPSPRCPHDRPQDRGHRRGPRARRVRMGRDDRLTPMTTSTISFTPGWVRARTPRCAGHPPLQHRPS